MPQQYAAAATVPLIKSPSLWLPPPVSQLHAMHRMHAKLTSTQVMMPTDIHPLPEDITAYVRSDLLTLTTPRRHANPPSQFVYPFTLEQHVVDLQPPPHIAIAERRARLAAVLHAREVEEEQREKAALHRVAPGYNPASVLTPTHARSSSGSGAFAGIGNFGDNTTSGAAAGSSSDGPTPPQPADPMDALVAQLEEMESSRQR